MRIFSLFFISIGILFNLNAQTVSPEKAKVLLPDTLKTARQVIDFLSLKTGFYFAYDSDLINDTAKFEKGFEDSITVETILKHLSKYDEITFRITNKHILVLSDIEQKEISSIHGTVLSQGEPLYGATVYLKNSLKGIITNEDGEFILKLPASSYFDTLLVSHIGCFVEEIAIKSIQNEKLHINLKPHAFALDEIIVLAVSAEALVRKMISNIKDIYPKHNTLYHSFYREEMKVDDNYKYFSEAVLEVFKNSYTHIFNSEKIKVIQSRTFKSSTTDSLLLKIKSGLKTALYLDVVRYQPDFLHEKTMNQYRYHLEETKHFDNDIIYIISFHPRNRNEGLYKGKIFINGKYNALVKLKFQYADHQKYRLRELMSKNYQKIGLKPIQASYVAKYQQVEKTWFLQFISTSLQFRFKEKKNWFSVPMSTKSSFFVVGLDTINVVKPRISETVDPSVVFSESNFTYEPEFWGKYNYYKPSNAVIKDLERMMKVKEKSQ